MSNNTSRRSQQHQQRSTALNLSLIQPSIHSSVGESSSTNRNKSPASAATSSVAPKTKSVHSQLKRKRGSVSNSSDCKLKTSMPKVAPKSAEEAVECGVCLEVVKKRGLLDSCEHVFCYPCISKWVKRCSSCPHCKRQVTEVKKTDAKGGKIDSTHSIKKRTLRDTLDREDFQQRRRQVQRRAGPRNQNSPAPFLHSRGFSSSAGGSLGVIGPLNTELTRNLLAAHQFIREHVARLSSGLRGLQDNLNNLVFLGNLHSNINITVNGMPLPSFGAPQGQMQTLHLPSHIQQQQNFPAFPPPPQFHFPMIHNPLLVNQQFSETMDLFSRFNVQSGINIQNFGMPAQVPDFQGYDFRNSPFPDARNQGPGPRQ